jgi:Ni,Fe-hydrogenase I large subunit
VKDRLAGFAAKGQLGIFANGYWGHPAYKLPPEVNLLAVAHYLEALDWQRDVVRLHTIFGGKNPHPNFLVGGMASAINLDDTATINAERLTDIRDMITRARRFVEQVYWPDLVAIAGFYKDWGAIGGGVPHFMSYGEFPEADIGDLDKLYFPRGIVLDMDLTRVHPFEPERVQEFINSSWYEYPGGDEQGLHPYDGETKAKYTGPKPPWEYLQGLPKYSWMKSPRYDGRPMQVGPLARALVGYARGIKRYGRWSSRCSIPFRSVPPPSSRLSAGLPRGEWRPCSWLDRWIAGTRHWWTGSRAATPRLSPREKWEPSTWPAESKGFGGWMRPEGRWGTGSGSRTGRFPSISVLFPAPGTAHRAMGRDSWDPMRRRW